jgi:hypothetical protein
VENCSCGASRRMFWVWRDSNDVLHASSFRPTSGSVQAVVASTARDALLPISDGRLPKHDVYDVDDPTVAWEGRCAQTLAAAAS